MSSYRCFELKKWCKVTKKFAFSLKHAPLFLFIYTFFMSYKYYFLIFKRNPPSDKQGIESDFSLFTLL